MAELTVLQAKRYGIYSCHCSTTLREAARRITDEDISTLVVVDDDGYLLGVITRIDLVRARCEREDWGTLPVEDYMSHPVITVTPKDSLTYVAHLLLNKQIHRVVVVQGEKAKWRPVAVVSAADLVYHMVKEA